MAHPFQIDGSSFPDWWQVLTRLMTHPFQIDGSSFPDWWLILSRLMVHPFLIDNSSFPDKCCIFLDWCPIHSWSMRHCSLLYPSSFPDWCPIISLLMPFHSVCTPHPFLSRSWNLRRSSRVHFGRTTWRKWSVRYENIVRYKKKRMLLTVSNYSTTFLFWRVQNIHPLWCILCVLIVILVKYEAIGCLFKEYKMYM